MGNYWTFRDVNYLVYIDAWRDYTAEGQKFLEQEDNAKKELKKALKLQKELEQKLKEKQITEEDAEYKRNQEEITRINNNLTKISEEQSLAFQGFFNEQYKNVKHKDLKNYTKEMKEISGYDKSGFNFQANFKSDEEAKRRDLRLKITSKMMQIAAKERLFYDMCSTYGKANDLKVQSQEFNLFYIYENKGFNLDTVKEAAQDRIILDQSDRSDQNYVDQVYNIFHKAIKTVDQESLDFLANKTEWTDEDIVNNFELIDKINRLTSIREDLDSQTRRNVNEYITDPNDPSKKISRPRRTQSKIDPELNKFFTLNEKALSKALELSQRAGFIQSMYYDKTEVKRPEVHEFIKTDLELSPDTLINDRALTENFVAHDEQRYDLTTGISNFKNRREQETQEFKSKSAEEKFDMFLQQDGLNDIYSCSFHSAANALSENIMLIRNVFRANGSDMASIMLTYTDDKAEQTLLTDGIFNATTQLQQDTILNMYSRVSNLDTNFTFTDVDHPENSVSIPRDMLLDPKFAERLRNEISPENLYNKIPEPQMPAKLSRQAQYEKDLAFSKLANSYKESLQKVYLADIERRQQLNKTTGEEAEKDFAKISNTASEISEKSEKLGILKDTDKVYQNLIKGKKKLSEFDKERYQRAAELITELSEFIKDSAVDAQMKKQLSLAAKAAMTLSKSQPGKFSKTELQQVATCIKSLDAYDKILSEQAMNIMDEKTEYQIAKRQDMVSILKDQFTDQLNDYKALKEGAFEKKQELEKTSNQPSL